MLLVRCETNREQSCKSATLRPNGPVEMHPGIASAVRHAYTHTWWWNLSRGTCMVFLPYSFPTRVSFLLTSSICQCLDFHFFQEKFKHVFFQVDHLPCVFLSGGRGAWRFILIVRYFWYLYIRLFSMTGFETFVVRKRREKRKYWAPVWSDRVEPNCHLVLSTFFYCQCWWQFISNIFYVFVM